MEHKSCNSHTDVCRSTFTYLGTHTVNSPKDEPQWQAALAANGFHVFTVPEIQEIEIYQNDHIKQLETALERRIR